MKVLIACEYSGRVRDAFLRRGHDAMSCDLLETEVPGPHYQGDVRDVLYEGWDLLIAHPPCTYLTVSANGSFKGPNGWTKNGTKRGAWRWEEVDKALDFVRLFMGAPIPQKAIENPIGLISSRIRKPDQTIQPHHFGHPEFKGTCLWLDGLTKLAPTKVMQVPERGSDEWKAWSKVHRMPPSPDRWKHRSRTYTGIADAMADQWGGYVANLELAA